MYNIAVLIPCYNESAAIRSVVDDFKRYLPQATIYVYDNNSTDDTVTIARSLGVCVRRELRQGKGHVVRRMFAEIEADIYVLIDGDATYEVQCIGRLIDILVGEKLDMVIAARNGADGLAAEGAYRRGHQFGNRFLTLIVKLIFGSAYTDMLSGFRVFSRRFVKSFPALSRGFEIETEMAVHAQELFIPVKEVATQYFARPMGSMSKLKTFRDGFRILGTVIALFKECRPLLFFGIFFIILLCLSLGLGLPVVEEYFVTGLVPRLPTAVLAATSGLLAFLALLAGLILDSVSRIRREAKHLAYLSYPALFDSVDGVHDDGDCNAK